jgi:hypothetical protein
VRTNVIDLNDARPQGHFAPGQLSDPDYVKDLKERAANHYRSILQYLWPNGKFVGQEFEVGDIHGSKGRSLKISCRRDKLGVGCDFAGNVVTGDIIDVFSYATTGNKASGRQFAEVCERLEEFLGRPFKPQPAPQEKAKPRELPPPTAQYTYTDAAGAPIVVVYRYDLPEMGSHGKPKKEFRPFIVAEKRFAAPKDNRPLYNIPAIAAKPWIVFVEGEKAADALIKAGVDATCAMSGSKAPVEKTDWSPLTGKHVVIWPDADEEGEEFAAKVRDHLADIATSVALITIPTGKTKGWDAADAIAEGVDFRAILNGSVQKPKGRVVDLQAWRASSFMGEPKKIEWLVDQVIPLGTAGLLVAMGDAGKGIVTLDLALKVALPKHDRDGVLDDGPSTLGATVAATGPAVILAAEDDKDEIHRRLHLLDPGGRRKDAPLFVVPLPNAGGPLPIIKSSSTEGCYTTPEWAAIRAQLVEMQPKLIILDPLASFVHADVNADPAAGAFVTGILASLATETGATVLVCHHMSKTRTPITTPEEARAAIRGSSAIVDGVRFAYALWLADENEGRRICTALGTDWTRNRVFKGTVVKSNAPADRTLRTYIRDMDTGLLVDRSGSINANRNLRKELELDDLCASISAAASRGFPYAYSGSAGLFERRGELPDGFQNIGRDRLRKLADDLLAARRIARVRLNGQSSPWLDTPDGDFAQGLVALAAGAYSPEEK